MNLDEVLTLINNLDMREPLRRYGPKWSSVFVGRAGEVLGVHRHKESLEKSHADQEDAKQHPPGTFFFITTPGMYATREKLLEKVMDTAQAYELEAEIKANPLRRWFGKMLVLRRKS